MELRKRQLKILVDARLAEAFKTACEGSGVSMAAELAGYMERSIRQGKKPAPAAKQKQRTDTRRGRRAALHSAISRIAAIRNAEEEYKARIPENLHGGAAYENAEAAIDMLDEAIALLEEAFG